MDLLYLSHCVPDPPDKGEKIRAHHALNHLARRDRVHLVCFARRPSEIAVAQALRDRCASVYVEPCGRAPALCRAAVRFAGGRCLTTSYFGSRKMRDYVGLLPRVDCTYVYSSAMIQYAPPDVPMLLDMVDVDSEKWLAYGLARRPGWPYTVEGRRLRRVETRGARRASCTFLSTEAEVKVFQAIAPDAEVRTLENGVDFDYFDRWAEMDIRHLEGSRFLVFTGAMDYYPNVDAACWFATDVLPALRRNDPALEFLIVGRDPASAVRRLEKMPGITVTGTVPDVRPYLLAAQAAVAPLRIARGIQNKVIEALAMGKPVYASDAVCATFGWDLPPGVFRCSSAEDYIAAIEGDAPGSIEGEDIIHAARRRFSWEENLQVVAEEMERLVQERSVFCATPSF
jgi:sugar transferase (PEP-CTERM/EpsH1 system associated)